jgi:DMSO/TMAO reductase YedYZ molybdopterin-dependent catalytic subunit
VSDPEDSAALPPTGSNEGLPAGIARPSKTPSEESAEATVDATTGANIGDNQSAQRTTSAVPDNSESDSENEAIHAMRRMSRRGFLWTVVAAGAGYGGLRWLNSRRLEDGTPWPFRQAMTANEMIARDLFNSGAMAPEFAASQAVEPRVNGDLGLGEEFDPAAWMLNVDGLADGSTLQLTLHDIKSLPRYEMVTQLKCIEGWSVIVRWAGARFVDFAARYGPATTDGEPPDVRNRPEKLLEYVGLQTPDGGYYVGLDRASALHPQTLLCYEMNGAPLTLDHGAPLRLVTPLKYGIKNIKRIGSIHFTDRRPADYWAEQGYDYYAGH